MTDSESPVLDPNLVRDLRGTRRWVKLLAWIAIGIAAFLVAAALLAILIGAFRGELAARESGILLVMIVFAALLWAAPGLQLHRFARTLERAEAGAATLGDAVREQHYTWRLIGVIAIVVVAGYVVFPLLGFLWIWLPH